ncbi:YALI0F30063p [Yarrowia lipolytica CLIB122]|uniref:YALI0F30063p n=2 Tax=Yarrowia lipolytica TaxID=4952 RepID=Q6BZX9_YARLI|nr:YALI0F30063p [Yarrowia lipolytica CLIB122]AOW07891.1 hypothetical protein YALI1_F37658g [Yarrowia lipolytica]KAB8282280.1 transmembrane amino acid transporter protein-domain-containing protein [Yarrowia lipolytica]KAE8172334.1 transmembrane amino acid transporter protein-domain-containing protein [Yarrowia lipolytica]KAJ8055075.1 transmembrane amino acid transporter protein-domain-containing protein [Yarrowia lipolytica]RMI99854.1 transmembrane amino acid transporter protein-domain-containi|eukprot:XP_506033.1 YALI0F30063p [Yarrowia lipolytica CLIB122]
MSYGTAPIDYPPDRQRRSSILIPSIPSSPFTGVNSLGRFASSFQRAQSFLNLDPPQGLNRERTYFDDDEFSPYRRGDHTGDDESVFDESDFLDEPSFAYTESVQPRSRLDSLVSQDAPLLVKRVENADGTIVTSVEGQSTAPQTVFNSVNVLIGVGLLSLPLGFKYAGWGIGMVLLLASAYSTHYTAKLLAKCMDTDPSLVTYADIGYAAFGSKARVLVSLLFSLELVAACVSLVVLFADSLNALVPQVTKTEWKVVAFFVLTPPTFLPLSVLSISSIMGIMSVVGLVVIVFIDGLVKPTAPGSLLDPMPTSMFPHAWILVPLSFGIFMAPWGGHAVFPNIYRDMRHPQKYTKCLKTTYRITLGLDLAMGVLGFLMFGDQIQDEVTKNILTTEGYPAVLNVIVTVLIALIPLSKTPLNARPIISTLDALFNIQASQTPGAKIARVSTRCICVATFVILSMVFPSFDKIIALMGSGFCVSICLILPLSFYLKIFRHDIKGGERFFIYALLLIYSAVAVVGTIWSFLGVEPPHV